MFQTLARKTGAVVEKQTPDVHEERNLGQAGGGAGRRDHAQSARMNAEHQLKTRRRDLRGQAMPNKSSNIAAPQ